MKSLPSRLKIALLSSGISGVVLMAFGAVMWVLIYDMRIDAVDREIRTLASRHPGLFAGRGNYERLADWLEFTFGNDYTNHVLLEIRTAQGQRLYRSPYWPENVSIEDVGGPFETNSVMSGPVLTRGVPQNEQENRGGGRMRRGQGMGWSGPPSLVEFTKQPEFFTERTRDSSWRFGVLGNDDISVLLGLNQQGVEDDLNHVRGAFFLTLPVALFLVGLGGWAVAGRALRPLKTIADTAERVTARGLDQRVPASTDDPEVARLINVLNGMMDRLEKSFRQATRFTADASHELKTPLTVMQGELENALQTSVPGSPEQELFSNLLEEAERLKTITRSLLLLAQADAGQLKLSLEPVDVSAELENMLEDAQVLAAELRLAFEVRIQPQLRVRADPALLRTAMFNLVSNAIKYNEEDGRLSIQLNAVENEIRFVVGNTGPGIPVSDQPKLFERFFRVDRIKGPRLDGIGLGLSLAREIVRGHGGDLWLEESRPEWTQLRAFSSQVVIISIGNQHKDTARHRRKQSSGTGVSPVSFCSPIAIETHGQDARATTKSSRLELQLTVPGARGRTALWNSLEFLRHRARCLNYQGIRATRRLSRSGGCRSTENETAGRVRPLAGKCSCLKRG